jgi:hypothetical protein
MFITLNEGCCRVLKKQLEVCNYLKNRKAISVNAMYIFNKSLQQIDAEVLNDFFKMQKTMEIFPTYYYPVLIVYYSWVRNVFSMKMDIYKQYQCSLVDAENNEQTLKEILSGNLFQETVSMEVSLEPDNFGEVIRISPDYKLYLGSVPDRGSPLGYNVNQLIPDLFQDIHREHMKDSYGLYKISNILRDVLICKFDGYLAKARMVIKI